MQKERELSKACPNLSSFVVHMKQMQYGEKSYPNNCLTEILQSKSDRDQRTLAHSNTHAKKGGKLKAEKPRPSR